MKAKITAIDNGPLKLESDRPIIRKDEEILDTKKVSMLCRCGKSKNMPFCDGSHGAAKFSSSNNDNSEILQEYKGENIHIHFNRSICSGAANCVHNLPSVFKSDDSKNWIFPDNDSNANIIATVNSCPSGALSYSINKETFIDNREVEKITVIENGPLDVEAVELVDKANPTNCSNTKYSLCRCGKSKNKPYCDYSHGEEKWVELKSK